MPPASAGSADCDSGALASAWGLLLAARTAAGAESLGVDAAGAPARLPAGDRAAWLERDRGGRFEVGPGAPPAVRTLLDLYAPLCGAAVRGPFVIGHLGQSLDGCIATASGDSYYVTGPDNLLHLHRLRALCDAVIVGAATIERDDPQLTVRRVAGSNPVRVVLDPRGRLPTDRRVFAAAGPPTLLIRAVRGGEPAHGSAEVLTVPSEGGRLRLDVLLAELSARGLQAVLVEGGGVTVSAFLEAGLLDRLHVAIAPLVTGAGRPGLALRARDSMTDCLRPRSRVFAMGMDVLYDCDLRTAAADVPSEASALLARVI